VPSWNDIGEDDPVPEKCARWLVTKTIVSPMLVRGQRPVDQIYLCGKVQSHRIVSRFTVFEPD
jgi:hypothetical protein